jgi:ATP-dependent Clp endopeptidase proteolytic subunit ClpP
MAGRNSAPSLASRFRTTRPMAQLRAGRRDWYSIKTVATDDGASSAEIMIYEEIGYFGVSAADFANELKALDVDQIAVRINSPGGEVWDGLAIYNALRDHKATVTTYVDGIAASAASVILQAGDTRIAAKASQVMIHDGWGLVVGGAEDMRSMADLLDQTNGMLADIYADRAGGDPDDWRAAMKAETWYTGTEAKNAGLVDATDADKPDKDTDSPDEEDPDKEDEPDPEDPDESTEPDEEDEDPDNPANSWDLSVFSYAGRSVAPEPKIIKPSASVLNWDGGSLIRAVKEALK